MREIPRTIDEVRDLRGDLSSWLVHLTKDNTFLVDGKPMQMTAKACLERILVTNTIQPVKPVGHFRFSKWYPSINHSDLMAVCLTETPIDQIYLFIAILGKALNFSSYGLVFSYIDLAQGPNYAAPVMYVSQPKGDMNYINHLRNLGSIAHGNTFKDFLFLFDTFGESLNGGRYNFRWEREWRVKGCLQAVSSFVKFGLCPEPEISYFESRYPHIPFIDPFFTPKQIEAKLKLRGIM
jgi:hypothetical protein